MSFSKRAPRLNLGSYAARNAEAPQKGKSESCLIGVRQGKPHEASTGGGVQSTDTNYLNIEIEALVYQAPMQQIRKGHPDNLTLMFLMKFPLIVSRTSF